MRHYVLFRRKLIRKGKPVRVWYYYYIEDGKQIQRTCGQHGKPCLLRKEAEAFVAAMEKREREKEARAGELRVGDIAAQLYVPGSRHMRLKEARGGRISETTRLAYRRQLDRYIVPRFGGYSPADIEPGEVEDWLIDLPLSNSARNWILLAFNALMKEALRSRCIKSLPAFESFRRNGRRKDIFTKEELKKLFPQDEAAFLEVWKGKETRFPCARMFGVMFYIVAATGMRLGEIRALQREQFAGGGIYIDRMIDSTGQLVRHLKKGTEAGALDRAAPS